MMPIVIKWNSFWPNFFRWEQIFLVQFSLIQNAWTLVFHISEIIFLKLNFLTNATMGSTCIWNLDIRTIYSYSHKMATHENVRKTSDIQMNVSKENDWTS